MFTLMTACNFGQVSIANSPLYNNAQGIALSPDGTRFVVGNLGAGAVCFDV